MLGLNLTLLIGPTVALPAPQALSENISRIEVTHSAEGRSGFQVTFQAGRGGLFDVLDYPLVANPLLRPFNRVIMLLTLGAVPSVLMDGIITHHQLTPGEDAGAGSLTITGEDVSVMMDLHEKSAEHPAQDETIIALKLIASYAKFGLIPIVVPPTVLDPPIPIERTPVQQGTDLAYLNAMAARHGYVFYVSPGSVPFTNFAYWGPPKRLGVPQRALTVNMGPHTNVAKLSFQSKALEPALVEGQVQDRLVGEVFPVRTFASLRFPLSLQPGWLVNQPNVRTEQFRRSGLTFTQALGRAQGRTDRSTDKTVTGEGELDGTRYGAVLKAGELVGVRGAGVSHDGLFHVDRVTHELTSGQYTQRFRLSRDGLTSTTPVVVP